MRIDELTIQNFKCFENETFHFNPHFNVIIGKNASGKSSLLDALAVAAGRYFEFIGYDNARGIGFSDVRKGWKSGQPKQNTPVYIDATGNIHGTNIKWKTKFDFEHRLYSREGDGIISGDDVLGNIAKYDLALSRTKSAEINFPLLLYYTTDRLWNQNDKISYVKNEKISYFKQEEGIFLGYKDCLSGHASSDVFLSWFKTFEYEVERFHQPLDEIFLKLMKETISSIIPEWTNMDYSPKDDELMGSFKDENGVINKLPFSNLSDGYRNMIAMVADMVYRCIQLNPGLREKAVTDTDGIVLIDELDLHLHPEWQRKVVGDLKRVFPKVQFFATTHSPFIIQSLKQEELIVLDKSVVTYKDPFRESIEEIAENEMQVSDIPRSKPFMDMIEIAREYFNLVKQNDDKDTLRRKIDVAKLKLDKLRVIYDDDPAFIVMLETELEKSEHYASN